MKTTPLMALISPLARATAAVAVTIAAFSATVALAQSAATAPSEKPSQAVPAAKSMMQPTDLARSMDHMQKNMASISMTGDPDQDFAAMMKAHHEGAIEMAQVELAHGKDPVMRGAATKIIRAQKKEIAEFERWMHKHPPMTGEPGGK